jgi:branched-chain amino acid transport system substrate-binding protein
MGQTKVRFSLLLVLVLYLFAQASLSTRADDKPRLTVAFLLPLTGDLSFLGNGIRDGALLAKQDLERENFPVMVIFEDNQGDLAASTTAARRLLAEGKVDAFVSIISGVGKLLKPMTEKAHVINIGICSDTEVADGNYSFIHYLTAEQGAVKYVDYFASTFGPGKSVGIISMNEAGFQKIVEEVATQARDTIHISFTEYFDKGVSDFKTILLRNKSKKPDALLILGLSPEIELIARQFRSLGNTVPLTSIEGFGLSSQKSAFEGAWFVDSAVPNSTFRNRFEHTYRREVGPGVGHSYDSVLLLAKAFGHGRLNSRVERLAAAQNFREIWEFDGVTGKLRVRTDGVIWSDASVKKIVHGQPVPIVP